MELGNWNLDEELPYLGDLPLVRYSYGEASKVVFLLCNKI
jgi:hypothetical protein